MDIFTTNLRSALTEFQSNWKNKADDELTLDTFKKKIKDLNINSNSNSLNDVIKDVCKVCLTIKQNDNSNKDIDVVLADLRSIEKEIKEQPDNYLRYNKKSWIFWIPFINVVAKLIFTYIKNNEIDSLISHIKQLKSDFVGIKLEKIEIIQKNIKEYYVDLSKDEKNKINSSIENMAKNFFKARRSGKIEEMERVLNQVEEDSLKILKDISNQMPKVNYNKFKKSEEKYFNIPEIISTSSEDLLDQMKKAFKVAVGANEKLKGLTKFNPDDLPKKKIKKTEQSELEYAEYVTKYDKECDEKCDKYKKAYDEFRIKSLDSRLEAKISISEKLMEFNKIASEFTQKSTGETMAGDQQTPAYLAIISLLEKPEVIIDIVFNSPVNNLGTSQQMLGVLRGTICYIFGEIPPIPQED